MDDIPSETKYCVEMCMQACGCLPFNDARTKEDL